MTDLVLDSRDGIATLTINRPHKRNAMTLQMWRDLAAVATDVATDPSVRVLLVTGGQHFSAGADIGEFSSVRKDAEGGRAYDAVVECAEQALIGLAKPTIAVVSGYCVGGGCEIALACDIRLASDDAVFAITPAKVGLVYSLTGMQRLVDTVGPAWAKQILFSAEQLPAATAARIGLVNEVCAPERLEERAMELARTISRGARTSVAGSKVLIERILRQRNVAEDLTIAGIYDGAYSSDDYREGVSAFLEKRAPNFLASAVELPG